MSSIGKVTDTHINGIAESRYTHTHTHTHTHNHESPDFQQRSRANSMENIKSFQKLMLHPNAMNDKYLTLYSKLT